MGPKTWHLPHFAVVNPNKSEKGGIIFDAAAELEGTSFNKSLLQRPDCLSKVTSM